MLLCNMTSPPLYNINTITPFELAYIPTCTCTHHYMLHALVQEPILRESMKLLAMVQVD